MGHGARKYLTSSAHEVADVLGRVEIPGLGVLATIGTEVEVGAGNIIKISQAAAADPGATPLYVAFGDTGLPAPTGSTNEISVVLWPADSTFSGETVTVHYVIATGDFVRASANVLQVEVIKI